MAITPSPHAATAKAIRSELKALGISASVTSERFSMGNAVRVSVTDLHPDMNAKIRGILDKYEYGSFDGMTDCYNIDNARDDIPQVKFVSMNNHMSDELRAKIYAFVRQYFVGADLLPPDYEAARDRSFNGDYVAQFVYRQFAQSDSAWWAQQSASVAA
jgi:hypothetical protein